MRQFGVVAASLPGQMAALSRLYSKSTHDRLPRCARKQKGLALDSENSAKSISLKLKELVYSEVARLAKKRGPQNEGKFHYVTENTWRKNVSPWVCQDVVERK
jgi:hypothetical protein